MSRPQLELSLLFGITEICGTAYLASWLYHANVLGDKEGGASSSPHVVTNSALADALFRANIQAALRPFMGTTRTIAEAAAFSGIKANTLYVQVQRLVAFGLLRVVREQPRAGRATKFYQAVHRRIFIPYDVLSAETFEQALGRLALEDDRQLYRSLAKTFSEDEERLGWLLVHTEPDELWFHAALYPGLQLDNLQAHRPAVINTGDELRLNFEDAKAFQKDLLSLYKKYKKRSGNQVYLFRLALAPKR